MTHMTATRKEKVKSSQFMNYPATKKLQDLAKNPFDLAKEGNLTPERIRDFALDACGWKLLYGTERVTKEVVESLISLSKQANVLEKMQRMQSGEVINRIEGFPSDNRSVLHTAMRDFFDNPRKETRAQQATEKASVEVKKLERFLQENPSFKNLVSIGIGGSSLGPQAVSLSLKNICKSERSVHFIANVDPDNAATVLRGVNLKETLVLVVSKSGSTLETCTNEAFAREAFVKEGLNPKEHFISVTGENSPMDNKERYLECFHIWDYVGGRFCSSSLCGGIILAFAYGMDVYWEFLKGAHEMDKNSLEKDVRKNLSLFGALLQIWNRNFLNHPITAIVPYSRALYRWAAHVQQVEMESNGKQIDRYGNLVPFETCPICFGEPGTNSQHSFFQLIHQGTTPVPVEMIGFRKSQLEKDLLVKGTTSQEKLLSNLFAQSIALAEGKREENPNKAFPGNRPSHILLADQLTPFRLGTLFAYFEHKVAFQGFIWDINSFDQEGVELGKVLANKILAQFAAKREGSSSTSFPLGKEMLNHL